MQEEVENRTLTLVVSGTKFTGRLFKAAITKYLAHRNICSPCRVGLVAEIPHFFNEGVDPRHSHAVNRLAVCSGCHIAWFCLYPLVCQQIELWIVQIAV